MFSIGDTVQALTSVNVRQVPGYDGSVVTHLQPGDTTKIISNSQCSDGLTWWPIVEGWAAEATPDGFNLLGKVAPQTDWERSIAFVLKHEGGYVDGDKIGDPGGETNMGISKRSYPNLDIRNLTREQVAGIYFTDYWQASGADTLSWPMCLVQLDSAVNCGVGQAQKWLQTSNRQYGAYLGLRLHFYTVINGWVTFGAAWVNRLADLLKECS